MPINISNECKTTILIKVSICSILIFEAKKLCQEKKYRLDSFQLMFSCITIFKYWSVTERIDYNKNWQRPLVRSKFKYFPLFYANHVLTSKYIVKILEKEEQVGISTNHTCCGQTIYTFIGKNCDMVFLRKKYENFYLRSYSLDRMKIILTYKEYIFIWYKSKKYFRPFDYSKNTPRTTSINLYALKWLNKQNIFYKDLDIEWL